MKVEAGWMIQAPQSFDSAQLQATDEPQAGLLLGWENHPYIHDQGNPLDGISN